jgi:hypothetical protein
MPVAVVVGVLIAGACGNGSDTARATITSPKNGSEVRGNVVSLGLKAEHITITKADGDTSGKTGHVHVFIDRQPVAVGAVIPKEAGIVHSADLPVVLMGLTTGTHHLAVVLGDGVHHRLPGDVVRRTVKVLGPAIDASAPATVATGQPVVITVRTQGFDVVPANGDTTGTSGHLHVFVDRDPTPAGQSIPKEAGIIHSAATTIEVPGLAPGEHVLWVVAGNGIHVPFAPRVIDKLTVTVT